MMQRALYLSLGKILTIYFLSHAIVVSAEVKNIELYFWPTAVEKSIDNESYLYAWPEFKVLLQTRDDSGRYWPAVISKAATEKLDKIFEPGSHSPIRIFNDHAHGFWGLAIPGSYILHKNNSQLLRYMLEKFIECLGALSEPERQIMQEVINAPTSLLSSTDGVMIDEIKKLIVAKMLTNLRSNSCVANNVIIPEQIKKKGERYLNFLLIGDGSGELITDGEILVFSKVFGDFLFSPNGLWVKAVLFNIKELITRRLRMFPIISDVTFLQRNYESFVDFILINKNYQNLTKAHVISFAEICGINNLSDIFSLCSLKQLSTDEKIGALNINLGQIKSVFFMTAGHL